MAQTLEELNINIEQLQLSYKENPYISCIDELLRCGVECFYLDLSEEEIIIKKKEIINFMVDMLIPEHQIYYMRNLFSEDEMNSLLDKDKKDEFKDVFNKMIEKTGFKNIISALKKEKFEYFPTNFIKNNVKYNGFENAERFMSLINISKINLFKIDESEELFEYLLRKYIEKNKVSKVIEYLREEMNNDNISTILLKNITTTINFFSENQISIEKEMSRKDKYFSLFDFLEFENIYDVELNDHTNELIEQAYHYTATIMKNSTETFSELCGDDKYTLANLIDPLLFAGLIKYSAKNEPEFIEELLIIVKDEEVENSQSIPSEYFKRNRDMLYKIHSLKEKEDLEKVLNKREDVKIKKRL